MADTSVFELADQGRLELSLRTRERIVNEMTAKGLPTDKEDRQFLLSALDGMDRTVLTRARIKSDEKANQTQQQTAGLIAQLLTSVTEKAMRSTSDNRKDAPMLPKEIVINDIVTGEMEVGVQNLTYETFMETVENKVE